MLYSPFTSFVSSFGLIIYFSAVHERLKERNSMIYQRVLQILARSLSYSNLDKIDVGVYVVVTNGFRKRLCSEYKQKWQGSLTFEKVCRYLPHFRSAIQVPIFVYGLEE
jgi:hypothetical protein